MTELMSQVAAPVLPTSVDLGEILEQVWTSFLDGEITAMPGEAGGIGTDGDQAMVASVSISGDWTGHLMIMAGNACAGEIAAAMFQMDAGEVATAEVADALGEIANMIGGGVKGMIGVPAALSLPQVVLDASALVNPDAHKVVSVSAQWNGYPLEVSLWERSRGAGDAGKGL